MSELKVFNYTSKVNYNPRPNGIYKSSSYVLAELSIKLKTNFDDKRRHRRYTCNVMCVHYRRKRSFLRNQARVVYIWKTASPLRNNV